MAQVTGIVKLYVNGKMLRSKPGAKLKVGGMKRDAVVGHSVYGYVEEPVASELDATLAHMSDTDARELSDLTEQTLRFETDTGQTYTVNGAWTSEPCELSGGGDLTLKMMGPPAIKE
jgi:hypothetical protein